VWSYTSTPPYNFMPSNTFTVHRKEDAVFIVFWQNGRWYPVFERLILILKWEGSHIWSMQYNVEFGLQLTISSRTEENHGKR
jgi:hypothetical protein